MTILNPNYKVKDPSAELVYAFDWGTNWLAVGATIVASSFTITGADSALTKDNESIAVSQRATSLRLKAGTSGVEYEVTNRITTSEVPSQTEERTLTVFVQDQ